MSLSIGRSRNQQETKFAYDPYRKQQEQFLQGAEQPTFSGAYNLYQGLGNNRALDNATTQERLGQTGEQYDAAADEAQRRALTTGNRQGLYAFLGENARERASGLAGAGREASMEIAQRKAMAAQGLGSLYGLSSQQLSGLSSEKIRDYTHGATTTGNASVSYGGGGGGGGGGK